MKKLLVATTIAICLSNAFTPAAQASTYSDLPEQKNNEKTNEMIGFSSGAITGAAVAGPLGAIIGGVFGIMIADDINGDAQLGKAKENLAQATHSLALQQQSIIVLQTNLQKMQRQQMVQLAAYDEQTSDNWLNEIGNFETNLQFKTASFLVEDVYTSQLNSLASILTSYPKLKVKVTGFADKRGDSTYNKILSEQRAKAIKKYLIDNSVNADQINISGEGETSITAINVSVDGKQSATNIEDLFFARKVNIRLIKPNQQMTAAN